MTFNKHIRAAVTVALFIFLAVAFLIVAGSSLFNPQTASAQAYTTTSTAMIAPTSCVVFNNNFGYGARDYSSGGSISSLQTFLVGQGYFNSAYLGTGRFGAITLRSVAQFQAAHGVPATGFVGPLTRAVIQQLSCGSNPVPPTPPPATPVSLYNESPTVGPVGTTVTLTGFGFTNSNTIFMDGSVVANNVPISSSIAIACTTNPTCHGGINQSIVFTVPSSLSPYCPIGSMCPMYMRQVTPGQYTITVQNSNGTSNALTFTVTSGGTSGQQLSITGLDAPASLALGTTGTWTVHALSNGQGNLHYSVTWGDENMYTGAGIMAPQNTTAQSSASFTHSYARSGNYTPVFTVTDDYGHSATVSNTVVVTPLY